MSDAGSRSRPFPNAAPDAPADRTRLATLALHVGIVLYVVTGLTLALAPATWDWNTRPDAPLHAGAVWLLASLCLGMAALFFALTRGLRRHRRWAWTTAVVLFVVHLPSPLLPLAALGLFGLLSKGTR